MHEEIFSCLAATTAVAASFALAHPTAEPRTGRLLDRRPAARPTDAGMRLHRSTLIGLALFALLLLGVAGLDGPALVDFYVLGASAPGLL